MEQIQKGFTLIELMIVVAIIGILATVAIPAYQDYVVKAKLAKAVAPVDPVKLAIVMYYQERNSFISVNDPWPSLGMSSGPSNSPELAVHVTGCTVANCDGLSGLASSDPIVITLDHIRAGSINGNTVTMTPVPGATAITWDNTCQVVAPATSVDPVMKKYFNCP